MLLFSMDTLTAKRRGREQREYCFAAETEINAALVHGPVFARLESNADAGPFIVHDVAVADYGHGSYGIDVEVLEGWRGSSLVLCTCEDHNVIEVEREQ
ncbi:MAG: hypothetical protein ABIP75_03200 [Pyrinomonadaceae bacterium]